MSLPIYKGHQTPSALYNCLTLTRIQFHHRKVTQLITLPSLCFRDSATVTLTPGDGTKAHQSGVIGIANQFILQNGKKLRGVYTEAKILGPKHCPAALLTQH